MPWFKFDAPAGAYAMIVSAPAAEVLNVVAAEANMSVIMIVSPLLAATTAPAPALFAVNDTEGTP